MNNEHQLKSKLIRPRHPKSMKLKQKCSNDYTWFLPLPKFVGTNFFFLHLWGDKPLWVELKLCGGVTFVTTLLLFHLFRKNYHPEK